MPAAAYRPEGCPDVSPYLIVHGAAATIGFLKQALGATELRRHLAADGRIRHAEVRIGDGVVMLADAAPQQPPVPAHVHVYVPDVDAAYQRALQAGAEPLQAPMKKADPDRRAAVRDAGGTTWWIATLAG
ncbi:VOC family protein [Caldimonas thermodepolymerans]|uniref:Extradiol dioxygenase n=1 Tax=Caldimonas thermodepolymerans TaxID=215580 RepID=A0A2S5T7V8_9BURK|nr:VOC family protein [Caldimonas thermodepolymerans]PPE71046.1 extradiol dioxygenase [Caldimonas thermodepolymerans]QPC31348.1 VOC family protein [Caldimonas thermodepolymerans]RDH99686.1 putative glyoxalase superfamily protein PhnB [Caldimonas thermodepolymerans]TCP07588.1 putative glyoxalase superfamily protein PhnB [Caldimonas thermodepolymerans]UZG47759.1 VOC family protein [Caldimonas thermodepolymerans]